MFAFRVVKSVPSQPALSLSGPDRIRIQHKRHCIAGIIRFWAESSLQEGEEYLERV
jgi:hypothetical protein